MEVSLHRAFHIGSQKHKKATKNIFGGRDEFDNNNVEVCVVCGELIQASYIVEVGGLIPPVSLKIRLYPSIHPSIHTSNLFVPSILTLKRKEKICKRKCWVYPSCDPHWSLSVQEKKKRKGKKKQENIDGS